MRLLSDPCNNAELYKDLEAAEYYYAVRLKKNAVLESRIAHRLTRPVGRPSKTKVKRFYEEFEYQAQSWDKPRRVVAKIEWHPDELFPRLGFIVTNLPMEPEGRCCMDQTIVASRPYP